MSSDSERDVTHDGRDAARTPGPPFPPPSGHDLTEMVGLPLRLTRSGRLEFGDELPVVAPQPRTLEDLRPVLYNQTASGPEEAYLMYRGVGWAPDVARYSDRSLRYDVTVVVPGLIGGEYVKTAGHYHPGRYPELYQVAAGRAHFLLQKPVAAVRAMEGRDETAPGAASSGAETRGDSAPSDALADVIIVDAGPGEALFVPPGYGHVTINPGPEPLVMVNVVDATFNSVYGPYRAHRGGAYYEIEEQGQPYFVANDHYPSVPEPRLVPPTKLEDIGLEAGEPLYTQLVRSGRAFVFLTAG